MEEGGTLDLVATPEGVLLERRRPATVRTGDDGLPVVATEGAEQVRTGGYVGEEKGHRQDQHQKLSAGGLLHPEERGCRDGQVFAHDGNSQAQ